AADAGSPVARITARPRQWNMRFMANLPCRPRRLVFPHYARVGRPDDGPGDALGLTTFGVNLTRLEPGASSALRHWHLRQDEFVYVLEGEVTLVTDEGDQVLGPGTCAGCPGGVPNGHHLVNRTSTVAAYLEVGDRL